MNLWLFAELTPSVIQTDFSARTVRTRTFLFTISTYNCLFYNFFDETRIYKIILREFFLLRIISIVSFLLLINYIRCVLCIAVLTSMEELHWKHFWNQRRHYYQNSLNYDYCNRKERKKKRKKGSEEEEYRTSKKRIVLSKKHN